MIPPRPRLLIGFLLAAAMVATRFNHFGSPFSLPDASLGVFFLAGVYLVRWQWLPIFIVAAGLMDWLSVSGGVSNWCITPAYGFLVPTYTSLWLAGRWYGRRALPSPLELLPLTGALGVGVTVAFAISNGSFYLFGGYFDAMPALDYLRATIGYFPRYAGFAFLYVAMAAAVHAAVTTARRRERPTADV